MSICITGVVKNGVVVPQVPLPEGAEVEIQLNERPTGFRRKCENAVGRLKLKIGPMETTHDHF